MIASKTTTASEEETPSGESEGITQESIERLLEQEQPSSDEITLDETFDILRNRRRRDVLVYLSGAEDNSATLSDVAEHVAAKENGIDEAQLSSTQRKRVYIGLYQCHLPKMDDVGVVEYDQDRGTVTLDGGSRLFTYLPEAADETGRSRTPLYAALGIAVVATVGGLGPGALAAVPTVAWLLLSSVGLVALGLYTSDVGDQLRDPVREPD